MSARPARVLLALLVAVAAFGVTAPPAAAATTDPTAEQALTTLLNGERTTRGLAALRPTVDLVDVARRHAGWMADAGVLQHNPSLATDVTGWTVLSENVGYSGTATTLHSALMNSSGHRANILDNRVTQVGVGAARDSRGTLWVTQVFRRPDASTSGAPTASLSAPAAATPALAVAAPGTLYAAERGGDGTSGVRTVTDTGFSGGATQLGGTSLDAPAIEATPQGQVSVVVRGADRGVWLRGKADSTAGWQPWADLGGQATSRPAVASWSSGRLDVVARGTDGALWHRSQLSPGSWTGWMSLGGVVADGSDPAIVSSGVGRLTVAVQGTDRQVWYRSYGSAGWTPWTPLGGHSKGGPALSSPAPDEVVVAVRGLDDAGWAVGLAGGHPLGWGSLGGRLQAPPSAAGGSGRVDVMSVGTDGAYYRVTHQSGQWSSWRKVG
jgi:hypothetical protein